MIPCGKRYGKAYATSREIEGVAVWVPGKYADMNMWGMLRSGAFIYGAKMGRESLSNLSIVSNHLKPSRKKLMKNKPYEYLMIIGISPASQGNGLGSKLVDAMNKEATRKGVYIYLETESEENLQFYEKHGFTVLQEIVLDKLSLPMWLMERQP